MTDLAIVDPDDFQWPPEILQDLATLTDRQRRFIEEYLIDFNATSAIRRAGYNPRTRDYAAQMGSKLLRHPKVSSVLVEMADLSAEQLGISRAYVMVRLREVADRTMEEEKWEPRTAVKALETLARLRGDLIERKQVDVRTVSIEINGVEMEDLR